MTEVILYCTDRGAHERVDVYAYHGPVPVPDGSLGYLRSSVFDLLCCGAVARGKPRCPDHRHDCGGCGRSPRPSETDLRTLIEATAATPGQTFDVSYWKL